MQNDNTQIPSGPPVTLGVSMTEIDRVIWRQELCQMMGVGSQCIREWIKAGKLPNPDIDMSLRTKGWRLSTLRAAGINLP